MKIKSIRVKDFLSIAKLNYTFTDGLNLFLGNNGAGKSSILLALQVGLYNKMDRPQPWARLSGAGGFTIEVDFIDIHGNEITTINNRNRNRFEVFENGELLTHQISKALPIVAEKLNLSYTEFNLLTFLTPSTVANILIGTDTSLISKFFSLDVLTDYDKTLREERKLLTRDKKVIEKKLTEEVRESRVYDVKALQKNLQSIKDKKYALLNSNIPKEIGILETEILSFNADITILNNYISTDSRDIEELSEQGSKCPTCGHDLEIDTTAKVITITKLRDGIEANTKKLKECKVTYDKALIILKSKQEPYESRLIELDVEISQGEAELLAASILEKHEKVDTEKLVKELTEIERNIFSLNVTIESIKSGDVHKVYLETFTSVLNSKLGELKENLSLSMRIIAKISSNGLSFSIFDDGVFKSAEILSAGEKVIVGLLVLSAMFSTLKGTLDIHVSTVILDEAIGAVATENMTVVERVLKNIAEDRCVIVTQHHQELPEELFDTIAFVEKVDGITEIKERV